MGYLPDDPLLRELDLRRTALVELPEESIALQAVRSILDDQVVVRK